MWVGDHHHDVREGVERAQHPGELLLAWGKVWVPLRERTASPLVKLPSWSIQGFVSILIDTYMAAFFELSALQGAHVSIQVILNEVIQSSYTSHPVPRVPATLPSSLHAVCLSLASRQRIASDQWWGNNLPHPFP